MKKGFIKIIAIIIIGMIILAFFKVDIKKFVEGETFKHNWELVSTQWQYLQDFSGTSSIIKIEYAYLLCQECLSVKKVQVKEGR